MGLDLVTVWSLILAVGLMIYVLLDGFYLGVGMLLLGVREQQERTAMLSSLAPSCGGNMAWLILCSVGLMVAFPLASSVIVEALYIPLLVMWLGLLLRGVAFQGLLKAPQNTAKVWQLLFSIGSLLAAFFQGAIVGALMQELAVENHHYVGDAWDWLSWFSALTGISLLLAYTLLGSTWLLATNKEQGFNRKMRHYSHHLLVWLGYAVTALQLIIPFLTEALRERWLGLPNFFYMGFVPMLALMAFVWAYYVIRFSDWKVWPISIVLIFLGTVYFTLITCLWPAIIPSDMTHYDAAASASSLELALWGGFILVLAMLGYLYRSYHAFFRKRLADKRLQAS